MSRYHLHRRQWLQGSAGIAAGVWLGTGGIRPVAAAPSEKLNIAVIGLGGQGGSNLRGVASENIVALCDVNDQRAGKAYERFPQAKKYYDYRRMFDAMENQIDAVVVSTPDHTHFNASMAALVRGKHLYCEKPMAHNVWQVRQMTRLAAEKKLATQLGVQRHTIANMHRVVELIRSGAIGKVTEVHSWVGGTRGMPGDVKTFPEVPSHLKWDLWLGPAAERKYSPDYCPYKWRFWWDFGTGETGNWGCHILDIPFWTLELTAPTRVVGSGPTVDPRQTPKSMTTRMHFPARGERGEVALHWYHTADGPPILKQHNLPSRGNNNLFIGTEGMLLCGFSQRKLYPEEKFEGYQPVEPFIAKSPGFHQEWMHACRGGGAATCNFDYSGPLSETVLLGNVAYRARGEFAWDAATLTASGNARAAELIREEVRKGWEVEVEV